MEILTLLFYIFFFICVFSFFSLAPWIPTQKKDLERINKIIDAKKGEKFLEVGCGTSVVSLFIAKNNPDISVVGVELSPLLYIISKMKIYFSGIKNIKIIYGNALKLDLQIYDIIYIFGLPETITKKILPQIQNTNKNNFRFISYCFKMTNNIFKETRYKEEKRNAIYVYKK